jgi:hypothetical protein
VRSVLLERPEHLLRSEAELEELSSLHLLLQLAPGDERSGFGPRPVHCVDAVEAAAHSPVCLGSVKPFLQDFG